MRYDIIDGDVMENLSINSTTGQIIVTAALDYESLAAGLNGTLTLTVMVLDSQQPAFNDTATLIIHVEVICSMYHIIHYYTVIHHV